MSGTRTIRAPRPKLHTRLPAVIAAGVVGAVVFGGVIGEGPTSYGAAVRDQRRAVTRAPAEPPRDGGEGDVLLCARGATGFASAAAQAAGSPLRRTDGIVEPSVLAAISSGAIEAGRWAEIAAGGPALPRRMGLAGDAIVAPPEQRCDGTSAFAQARVSVRPGLPATPPPIKAPASTKAEKKAPASKPQKKPGPKTAPKPTARSTRP